MFVDLKHRGLMDNTVVVVTTDNGGGPWDSNAPLRGTKVRKVCYAVYDHAVCYIVVWWPWEWYSNVPLRGTKVYEQYFWVLWKCSLFYTGSKLPIFRKPFTREVSEGPLSFTLPYWDVVAPTGVSFIVSFMFHQLRFSWYLAISDKTFLNMGQTHHFYT